MRLHVERYSTHFTFLGVGMCCLVILVFGICGCSSDDVPANTPDDPSDCPDMGYLGVHRLYQWDYYAFGQGRKEDGFALGLLQDVFEYACVRVDYSIGDGYSFDKDTVETRDYSRIWLDGHWNANPSRRESYPYLLASMVRHASIQGVSGESIRGLTLKDDDTCACGTARHFGLDQAGFSMVFFEPLLELQTALQDTGTWAANRGLGDLVEYAPRVWGRTMAHELGHLYACLKDAYRPDSATYHVEGYPCVMRYLNLAEPEEILNQLKGKNSDYGFRFCRKCQAYIMAATESTRVLQ